MHFTFLALETGKSWVWIDIVPGELVLPGSLMAILPAAVFLYNSGDEGAPHSLFYEVTKHTDEGFLL